VSGTALIDVGTAAQAAELLWRLWAGGQTVEALPERMRPRTVSDGWVIQRELDALAGAAAGWKIAATSAAGQAHIGADGPLAGRLYRRCIRVSGCELNAASLTMRVAEAEFAFRIAHDLPAGRQPPSRSEVLDAVGALAPAIEVPDSRFDDLLAAGLPSMMADGLCCGFLVLGEDVAGWVPERLAQHQVRMWRNGLVVARGRGRDVLGDPIDALTWLARHLHEQGHSLRAGDIVTTGACTPANPVANGDDLVADFGALGEVRVRFVAPDAGT
jgi:2-keto-4-pentenoate hydratase